MGRSTSIDRDSKVGQQPSTKHDTHRPLLRAVQIRNYRSLSEVVVQLGGFTVLVGPNGSGKSNFVDSLAFVQEALTSTLTRAVQVRGGIEGVRRRSAGHPTNVGFRLELWLPGGRTASYSFEIAARPQGVFAVKRETCNIVEGGLIASTYDLREGEFAAAPPGIRPRIEPDRLALTVLSAVEEFREIYDFLAGMRFYSLVPEHIRDLQDPDTGISLKRDGSNAAAVLREIQVRNAEDHERIARLLGKVVPGITGVEYDHIGSKETIRFRQQVGTKHPWAFPPINMSDGTLRVLGLLLAIFQWPPPPIVVLEEPESTVHPAAVDVLMDVFKEGQRRSQLLLTTHSPDILDSSKISEEELRVVTSTNGRTHISPLGKISRKAVRERLYTAGDLMRINDLEPDLEASDALSQQLDLFGPLPESQ